METRKTVRETKMFNSSGSFRDDLAAGKYIEGDPSGTKFICRVETPEMRVGWYIMLVDTILVTPEPPVDPPPVDPPPDGETITWPSKTMQLRNTVTGEVWQNEDPVILTRSNG